MYRPSLILIIISVLICGVKATAQRVSPVAGFPSAEPGFSFGVSASYAGRIGSWIVMAGGCNFPTPGNKTYYSGIYAARADKDTLAWRMVGTLPEPAAYGVTVQSGDSLLLIGGCNKEHGLSTVYSVHLDAVGERAQLSRLADLPYSVDNMAVAKTGNEVYVVGGNQKGKPSADILHLSLAGRKTGATKKGEGNVAGSPWKVVGSLPGNPRVQPVCAAYNNKVYIWGGFYANGAESEVHTDGYSYDVKSGKMRKLSAPRSVEGCEMTLAGGIAWADGRTIYATGGVNKDIFLDAISGRYKLVRQTEYLLQPISWYCFSGNLYRFDVKKGKWLNTTFADKALARAGAQVVYTTLGTYYIGGELKPAVRTPQIVMIEGVR